MSESDKNCHENRTDTNDLDKCLEILKLNDDPREKLRNLLNKRLRVVITDGRVVVGGFVCTDKDANIILESSFEYMSEEDGK